MINFEERRVKIISSYVPDDLCWNTPKDFIEVLTQTLSGTIDSANNEDFIIVGHQTPDPDQRNKIWARFTINRRWVGFYAYINKTGASDIGVGAWRKLYPYDADDILWKVGNSQNIPDGFELIDSNTGDIDSDVRAALIDQYVETSPGSGIYKYFAVRYIGY